MNPNTMSFSLNSLLNPPAQQSAYSAQNFFVTNSGLYDYTICEARYGTRMVKGVARQTVELRGVATHKLHPEHTGRLMLKLEVPNPNEPHPSDYMYKSLCVATNAVTLQQHPSGEVMVFPDFGEQVMEDKFNGGTYTQLNRLQNQRIMVSLTRREFMGRSYLNPSAVFDASGFSGYEIASGANRVEGAQPQDIKRVNLAYEGLPLEAVQRGGAGAQADSGFNAAPSAPQAPQGGFAPQEPLTPMQRLLQHAPMQQQAPMPPQHPAAPSAQAANPYAQMGQGGQQQPQQNAPKNDKDDEDLPF